MTTAARLIENSAAILLDFDGPICAVFGGLSNHQVATELRKLCEGTLPADVEQSPDPFDVLTFAAAHKKFSVVVEQKLTELEVRAVEVAPPTPDVAEVLASLHMQGKPVVVVSNNSADAVSVFLGLHELTDLVVGVSARTSPDIDRLKPQPYLLTQAAKTLCIDPRNCVMIGDSATDIEAAQRCGANVIAYANKPGKHAQFEAYSPNMIINGMAELI